jgi:Tol biopolymer transport system component
MTGRTIVGAGAAVLAALALAPAAHGAWGDAQLASVDNARMEQADGATSAVDLSADGRWVVFQTRATNFFADDDADQPGHLRQGGIFRFDRRSGQVALVADGDDLDELTGETLRRGATAPSVSDDGRWVVFSTAQQLVPQDDNDNVDVYVRDMAVPLSGDRKGGGAYQLVSARDGGDEPARYEPRDPPLPGRNPGAAVYAGQAISGDGRYVAFRTTEQASDLPDRPAVDTPGGNVFVRDLVAKRTVLVTRALADGTPAGGALAPIAISRDGSTVAWVGERGPRQTRMLSGESLDDGQRYYLWRRWDDPGAATRRVTGLADLDDPGCPADGSIAIVASVTGPCYGPLSDVDSGFNDIGGRAPALSADGWTVAFLSGAAPRPTVDADAYLDAYVTSMRPGVSRKAGTRTVTKGTISSNALANGDVESVAISADGSRLLLVTGRRQFLPPAPELAGDPRSSNGGAELYTVDLGAGGRTRRVLLPGGGDLNGTVDPNAALSADGRSIAFVSRATNLVFGDANQVADAFAVDELDEQQTAAPPTGLGEDPVDEELAGDPDESFTVRATTRADGTLALRLVVPEAGSVGAVAATRPTRAARAKGRARARPVRAATVASRSARARRRGRLSLVLKPKARFRTALRRGGALAVRVTVTLKPSRRGAKPRRAAVNATFRMRRPKRR